MSHRRAAVEQILTDAEAETHRLIGEHRSALDAIADALLANDELSGDEVRAIVAVHTAPATTGR